MFSESGIGRRSYLLHQGVTLALAGAAVFVAGSAGRADAESYGHPLGWVLAVAAHTLPAMALLFMACCVAVVADVRRLCDLNLPAMWLIPGWAAHLLGMFALLSLPWGQVLGLGSLTWVAFLAMMPGREHRRRVGAAAPLSGRTAAGRPLPPPAAARAQFRPVPTPSVPVQPLPALVVLPDTDAARQSVDPLAAPAASADAGEVTSDGSPTRDSSANHITVSP